MSTPTVIEQSIATHLGQMPDGFHVVPRERARWPRGRGGGMWRPLDVEHVLDLLGDLPGRAHVLVRPAAADPGAANLAAAAAMLGHEVFNLPAAMDEAVWSVGIARGLRRVGSQDAAERILEVVCCGPGCAPDLPHQRWGPTALSVPALRPTTLARWAYCAWRPCRWCAAGGLPGQPCRRCGVRVDATAAEVAA